GIFNAENGDTLRRLAECEVFPESDGTVTVTRRISRDGRSGAKINGRAVPLTRLRTAVSALLSIHGQQDTQAFALPERQLEMLDSFAKNDKEKDSYLEIYRVFRETESRIEALSKDSREKEQLLDMLRYRVNELSLADVYPGEREELESERTILANSEKIIRRCGAAYGSIYEREGSAAEAVQSAFSEISALSGIIPEADGLASRLESAKYELIDIADVLKQYIDNDGTDTAARLDEVETRIEFIKKLENKYRADHRDFPALLEQWNAEINSIENSDEELARLAKKLDSVKKDLDKAADVLSATRAAAAQKLCARVTEELAAVDMPAVTFKVEMRKKEWSPDGADEAEFLISANKGELPKPMAKIASGGELSRIMLCLKCVFADTESIGTLIFDEIDSGVSGSTSEKIGKRLYRAAHDGKTQVICVTHSAILASKADNHYKISKSEKDGRTETGVELLDREGRLKELSRIIGGINITEAVTAAAAELLEKDK
ncbi:MAG: DNA repair protein RecN, partial [Clostridia bacterium]|nr:DNA repair protein RecN [Clostridia bacterium]